MEQSHARLDKDGPNALPDMSARPFRSTLAKFWAPVPWLLETAIVLQLVLHKYLEASVITGLLVFNALLAFVQDSRAQATLKETLLRWQKEPEFQTAYREARRAAFGQSIARLQQASSAAVSVLIKVMAEANLCDWSSA